MATAPPPAPTAAPTPPSPAAAGPDGPADPHGAGELTVEDHSGRASAHSPGSATTVPLGPALPPATDLAAAVDSAPGTTVRRFGGLGDFAGLSVRGSSFRQVEVFVDGVPLNPDGAGAVDLSQLPAALFTRAQLYRGFAPPHYGSAAIGGVLDLETAPTAPASLGLAGGSWHTAHAWGTLGAEAHGVEIVASLDTLRSAGDWPWFDDGGTPYNLFDDRTYTRDHNTSARATGLLRARWCGPRTVFTALHLSGATDRQLPGTIASDVTAATYEELHHLDALSADTGWSEHFASTALFWWSGRRSSFADPLGEVAMGPAWTDDREATVGLAPELRWVPTDSLALSALLRGRWERYRPVDRLTGTDDGVRQRLAGGATVAAEWEPWRRHLYLTPVLQTQVLDNRLLGEVPFEDAPVAPGGEQLGAWLLPRAGLRWEAPGLSARLSAGRYLRPPDLDELFGSTGAVVGNTDLVPELGRSAEVGGSAALVRGPFHLGVDLALATQHARDLIRYVPNSQQTVRAVNIDAARIDAFELGATLGLGPLGWEGSATRLWSRNLSADPAYADKPLPNLPPWEATLTTSLQLPAQTRLSHSWSYTSATWADAANTLAQAPRSLHGLAFTTTPVGGWSVAAEILNLLDTRGMAVDRNPFTHEDDTLVVQPLTDFAGYPLPGRTIVVSLAWREPT